MSSAPRKKYVTISVTPGTAFIHNPHDDWTIHVNGDFVAHVRGKRMAGEVVDGIVRRHYESDDTPKREIEDGVVWEPIENLVVWALEAEGTYHKTFVGGKGYLTEMEEYRYGRNLASTIFEPNK